MPYSPPLPGQHLRPSLLETLAGDWQSYTPTMGNVTLGNGSLIARYQQTTNRVLVAFILNWGSTTTGAMMPTISTPITPASLGGMRWNGNIVINPPGTFRSGACWLYDTGATINVAGLVASNATYSNSFSSTGITMAANGWIMGSVEYEV